LGIYSYERDAHLPIGAAPPHVANDWPLAR
jgi:hypothetical protein